MGTRTTALIGEAESAKPMPLPKDLNLHNRRVAYATLVGSMKDPSENLTEDGSSLAIAEVLYNFTDTLSKIVMPKRNSDFSMGMGRSTE